VSRVVAGRFELLAPLGSGGVSEVHRARDRQTGAVVALKELLPQFTTDRSVCRRFLREAEVARRLDHPGIVRVLEAGEDAGRPYLVMELVEGEDLRRRIDREGALPWAEAQRIALAVAGALEHAHARGVVHRDLKPHNVLIEGASGAIKLADFGLARVQTLASLTGSSLVWGSPEYMAPELFGRGRADPRSDLFSFGVLLFEMVAGRLPWKDRSLARLAGSVRDVADQLPGLGQGPALDGLVRSLLAPSPGDRPSDVAEVIAVLEGRATPPLLVRTAACGGCGEPRPEDVPQCFSCGHHDLTATKEQTGTWSVVLKAMEDDVASMEALHKALGSFTGRPDLRLKFLIGHRALYSKKEQEEAIKLPAVLFSQLDETSAREIEKTVKARGFKAEATRRRVLDLWRHPPARAALGTSLTFTAVTGVMFAASGTMASSPFFLAGLGATAGLVVYWGAKLAGLRGLFALRPAGPPAPAADRLLGSASQASGSLQAPEVRALFVEVSRELYRLARRAEELARQQPTGSSEEALARRLLDAAPAVSARLEAIAHRLELLDAALERESDGDTMRALATLDRRLAAGRNEELELARRELEATLDRRHQAEAERERLSASLCRALARVRDSYRRARTLVTLEEREVAAVAAALEGLEASLQTGSVAVEE
jgi:serine/threonine protein kinase